MKTFSQNKNPLSQLFLPNIGFFKELPGSRGNFTKKGMKNLCFS